MIRRWQSHINIYSLQSARRIYKTPVAFGRVKNAVKKIPVLYVRHHLIWASLNHKSLDCFKKNSGTRYMVRSICYYIITMFICSKQDVTLFEDQTQQQRTWKHHRIRSLLKSTLHSVVFSAVWRRRQYTCTWHDTLNWEHQTSSNLMDIELWRSQ